MENLIKFLGNLQSYFNDFIGAVAPALMLVTGLFVVTDLELPAERIGAWGTYWWMVVMVALFAIGHLLVAISELLREFVPKALGFKPWKTIRTEADKNSAFMALKELVQKKGLPLSTIDLSFSSVRNIAMTLSDDGQELGRRFTFLSLFCYGTATASLLIGVVYLAMQIFAQAVTIQVIACVAGCVFAWWLLVRRGAEFELRARTVPFGTALAEVIAAALGITKTAKPPVAKPTPDAAAGAGTTAPVAPDVFPG